MRKFHQNFYSALYTFVLSFLVFSLSAQTNNLKVNFKDPTSAPRNVSVCGNEATVTVTVATEGFAAANRQNIQARLNLFRGVQLVRFESAGSSAGVTLANNSNPNRPLFSLPALAPNGNSSVDIQYVIKVDCNYADSLTQNNAASVVDKWDFTYDMGGTVGLTESDLSTEYRDQVYVPYFTMAVSNTAPNGARIGQCYQRTTLVNYSGLVGFVNSFIYTNLQGAGVSVKGVKVNGVTVTFTKTATFNADGDSLITVNLPDVLFALNTRGSSGGLADGDKLFEPDETVTIIEDICIANCDKARVSKHEMSWGCDSRFCNTITRQDIVRLGQGSVNVSFANTGSTPAVPSGYCANGSQTITFTNSGVEVDAGTGTMFDVSTGVGINEAIVLAASGYRITGIKIAGVNIPSPTSAFVDIKDNPLFNTNPDGAGGLEDIDGDGFYDDLAVNEKIEVTVTFEVDCLGSVSNRADYCTNDFEASFSARLDYTDLCQNRSSYLQPRFFAPSNTNSYVENCIDPDAKTDGTVFFIEHTEIRNVFNFEKNCGGQEKMLVAVKMPLGVSAVKDSSAMYWSGVDMPLLTMTTSNDTAYFTFDATAAQFLNGKYTLRLGFKANCSTVPGPSKFPIEIAMYCPPCDCRHNWYCDTLNGPRIHYTEGVCPPNSAFSCAKGLKTTEFQVERTTFGFTDETYATKIAAADANKKVALTCDSIQMTMKNVVGQTPISDSIGLKISYDNIVYGDDNKLNDIFIFDKGKVVITHGGSTYNCTIDATKMKAVRTDSVKAMYFDLHSCLVGLGIGPLSNGDSVNFVGNFSVNPSAPIKFTFEKVPNFRAFGYYVEDDSLYSCDNYGAMFRVGKSQALFSFPSNSSFPIGCSEANLEYVITMFNNDYPKYFGEEYRQSVGVDSFALDFDKNFPQAFTTAVSVSIPDHPFYGDAYFPMANLTTSGHYAARFDTLTRVPSLNRLIGHAFKLRIKITPNCGTVTGSTNGDSIYSFKPKIYYRDRYYARSIGDGSCSPYKTETNSAGNDHITHSYAAKLKFTPITNPSITIVSDTASWTMKVCNESEKGNATVTWIGVSPKTTAPSFRVISMTDVTNNLSPKILPFKYYGTDSTKAYSFMDGLTPLTPEKTIDDVCNVVRVVAIYKECGLSDINFKTGWLCAKPIDSLTWNPTKYAPCADSTVKAQVRTENPFIDANFINQTLAARSDICDTTTLEVLLRNTDLGTIYDIKTRLTIPLSGATLIPSTIAVAYPSGSAYKTVTQSPISAGTTQRGKNYDFTNFAGLSDYLNQYGLKGFNATTPNDSNEMKIRFQFVTDCDYRSGSLAYFSFQGKTICGTPSNFETGESLPIQIQGAALTVPKMYDVSTSTNNKLVPGGSSTIEIRFKNLTSTLSDSADEVSVKLPVGVSYKPNSSVAILPLTWVVSEPRIRNFGGIQTVSWKQPVGLQLNQEAALQFSVNTDDSIPCVGFKDIALTTFATKDLACTTVGTVCKTEIITTAGGEHYYSVPLSRGAITFKADWPITKDTLEALAGDIVSILAVGGQKYTWIDADTRAILFAVTDSIYKFTVVKPITRIIVKSSLAGGCMDSATITVKIVAALERHDTVYINDSLKFCFNTLNFTGPIDSVKNTCPTTSNRSVKYTIDAANCLIFKGLKLGTDTACYRVCAGLSNCKDIKFITTVISRSVDTIKITQTVGKNDTVCFTTKYLRGGKFVLTNICPNPLDTVVTYAKIGDTCVVITAINVGTSKSCWVLCDTLGNCDTTIIVTTINGRPKKDTIYRTVDIGKVDTVCLSFVRKRTSPIRNNCPNLAGTAVVFEAINDSCVISKGLSVGKGTSCWLGCDKDNICDTIVVITTVKTAGPKKDTIFRNVDIGKSDTFCIKLNRPRTTPIRNICPDSTGSVVFTVLNDTCIISKGTTLGKGKSCWVICDTSNVCDTLILVVNVTPPTVKKDTIFRNVYVGKTDTVCLPFNRPRTAPIRNICPSSAGTAVVFSVLKDSCIISSGVTVGTGKSCWVVCDTANKCDTIVVITTVTVKKDTIFRVVDIGKTDTVCLPFNRPRTVPIRNICPDTSAGAAVQFVVYKDSCVISKGLKIGKGTSCWLICDTLNKCDTITLVTTVRDSVKRIIAVEDTATTKINTLVSIPVTKNDTFRGKLNSIRTMVNPFYGTGKFVNDSLGWHYDYTPNKDFCGSKKIDAFIYEICNDDGCDTAFIKVKVLCNGLKIWNAISPNNDGKNDFFIVEGIEEFPNTKVIIYNRWGNRVYLDNNYKNNWAGNWGKTFVPDGTYFYQVILENGEQFTGFLQVHR
jgi:gliding motility-associated-like protein